MTLLEALGLGPTSRVALIGGGGKTTLLYQLGREARALSWDYRLSTTTRMAAPAEDPALWALPAEPGKLQGPGVSAILALEGFVAVEADGSRGLPLKVHAAHEPEVPPGFTVVLVAGMSALGRPVRDGVHRFELLDLSGAVDEELFLALVERVPADLVVLNQADDASTGLALARRLTRPTVVRGRWGQMRAEQADRTI